MRLSKILVFSIFILLLPQVCASSASISPYKEWKIISRADFSDYAYDGAGINITLFNGLVIMKGRITGEIRSGTKMSINILSRISCETIYSAIKVMVNNDTLLTESLREGIHTYQFYATRDYRGGEIEILLYDLGGNLTLFMDKITLQEPRKGVEEGLFLTGIGIGVVFSVLGFLAAIMYLFKPREKRKVKSPREQNLQMDKLDNDEIAAITAAIAAYLGDGKFKIIRVESSPWKYYGRMARARRWK